MTSKSQSDLKLAEVLLLQHHTHFKDNPASTITDEALRVYMAQRDLCDQMGQVRLDVLSGDLDMLLPEGDILLQHPVKRDHQLMQLLSEGIASEQPLVVLGLLPYMTRILRTSYLAQLRATCWRMLGFQQSARLFAAYAASRTGG